jgi:hypothetical protein
MKIVEFKTVEVFDSVTRSYAPPTPSTLIVALDDNGILWSKSLSHDSDWSKLNSNEGPKLLEKEVD